MVFCSTGPTLGEGRSADEGSHHLSAVFSSKPGAQRSPIASPERSILNAYLPRLDVYHLSRGEKCHGTPSRTNHAGVTTRGARL